MSEERFELTEEKWKTMCEVVNLHFSSKDMKKLREKFQDVQNLNYSLQTKSQKLEACLRRALAEKHLRGQRSEDLADDARRSSDGMGGAEVKRTEDLC